MLNLITGNTSRAVYETLTRHDEFKGDTELYPFSLALQSSRNDQRNLGYMVLLITPFKCQTAFFSIMFYLVTNGITRTYNV